MESAEYKKWVIQRRQSEEEASIKVVQKDFYDDLPRAVVEVLDMISWRWKRYSWFEEAWGKYRDHVLNAVNTGTKIKAPGYVFNEYIDQQVKDDYLNEEFLNKAQCECMHSDKDLEELYHFNDKHVPKGQPGAGQFAQKTEAEKAATKKEESSQNKEGLTIKDMEEANKQMRVYKEFYSNQNFEKEQRNKQLESDAKDAKQMFDEGRNITNNLANIYRETPKGSIRVNKKDYSNISDEELRKRVNRMALERQYGDMTGDTTYELTGKEKTREYLQTIGSILGIAGSAVGLYYLIKKHGN